MSDPDDLRLPVDPARLTALLVGSGCPWTDVRVVATTGSTNADLAAEVSAGAPEGVVLLAEHQSGGRGRLGRTWEAPAGSGLLWSVLLRPAAVPRATWGWIPLLVGLSAAEAVAAHTGIGAVLKWPNDLVIDGPARDGGPGPRKLGGILCEQFDSAVVAGVGINVSSVAGELPIPAATSLLLEAAEHPDAPQKPDATPHPRLDRAALLGACLARLAERYGAWVAAAGDAQRCGLAQDYRARCLTIGQPVHVQRADDVLVGTVVAVTASGSLQVKAQAPGGGVVEVTSGDVVHVRRSPDPSTG